MRSQLNDQIQIKTFEIKSEGYDPVKNRIDKFTQEFNNNSFDIIPIQNQEEFRKSLYGRALIDLKMRPGELSSPAKGYEDLIKLVSEVLGGHPVEPKREDCKSEGLSKVSVYSDKDIVIRETKCLASIISDRITDNPELERIQSNMINVMRQSITEEREDGRFAEFRKSYEESDRRFSSLQPRKRVITVEYGDPKSGYKVMDCFVETFNASKQPVITGRYTVDFTCLDETKVYKR